MLELRQRPKKYEKFKKEYGKCVYHIFIYPLFQLVRLFVETFGRTNCKIRDVFKSREKSLTSQQNKKFPPLPINFID